jgi:hypothetical protein
MIDKLYGMVEDAIDIEERSFIALHIEAHQTKLDSVAT